MAEKPFLMTTTLWDFPSQQYGDEEQGDQNYRGATPAYLIWNLLQRYTRPKDLVVDPMAGSGTTLDVARDLSRRALGYDLQPTRPDIFRCDARKLPLEAGKADFVFVDPPYSTHLKYSGDPRCLGELDAAGPEYYPAIEAVIAEIDRVLRPDRYMALYVSDSWKKGKPFQPIGFEIFERLRRRFEPVDQVAVVRHNRTLLRNHWHTAAIEGNYYLRGFNHLFIMYKRPEAGKPPRELVPPIEAAAEGLGAPVEKNAGSDASAPKPGARPERRPGPDTRPKSGKKFRPRRGGGGR